MSDPFEPALVALRRERDRIDAAIALMEAVRDAGGRFTPRLVASVRPVGTTAANRHKQGARRRLDHAAIQRAYEAGVSTLAIGTDHDCDPDYVRCLASRKGWRRTAGLRATPLFDGARAH